MTLETEMREEIKRLETELVAIDAEMQKLQTQLVNLINIRKKKEHNVSVLKANFSEAEEREIQLDLRRLLSGRQ